MNPRPGSFMTRPPPPAKFALSLASVCGIHYQPYCVALFRKHVPAPAQYSLCTIHTPCDYGDYPVDHLQAKEWLLVDD